MVNLSVPFNPSEKYESQREGLSHVLWRKKIMFQTTNHHREVIVQIINEKLQPGGFGLLYPHICDYQIPCSNRENHPKIGKIQKWINMFH